jgi:hypothetical protein
MPKGWLPAIPAGHPWGQKLTPADDAFYSYVEERIIKPNLFDETNPDHVKAIDAYLAKANSSNPRFVGWTYAGGKTECPKKMADAGARPDACAGPGRSGRLCSRRRAPSRSPFCWRVRAALSHAGS